MMWTFPVLVLVAVGGAAALTVEAPAAFRVLNGTTGNFTETFVAKTPIVVAFNSTSNASNFIHSQTWFTPVGIVPWAQNWTIAEYFVKVVRGEMVGARRCKKNHDCGAGLRCNTFWNWCAPWDAPIDWQEFGNNCTSNSDCSDLYYCFTGRCRFAGPRPCKSNLECPTGFPNATYDCVDTEDLEKHSIVQQLGRTAAEIKADFKPHKKHEHHHDHELEIESEEVAQFGPTADGDHLTHGKRCWARCSFDTDCFTLRFPEFLLKDYIGCCNGYCTRKQSCVSVPAVFLPTTVAPIVVAPVLPPAEFKGTLIALPKNKLFF